MVAQMAELVRNGGWKLREPLGKGACAFFARLGTSRYTLAKFSGSFLRNFDLFQVIFQNFIYLRLIYGFVSILLSLAGIKNLR